MKMLLIALIATVAFCSLARADDTKTGTPAPAPAPAPAADATATNKFITIGKKALPVPPQKPGCYQHTTEWQEVPCLSQEELSHIPPPVGVLLLELNTSPTPIQNGHLAVDIVQLGSEDDTQAGNNSFSLQLNSNPFKGSNGDTDWVQFTYQKSSQYDVLCIWPIDLTTGNYLQYTQCAKINSARNIRTGDVAELAGSLNGNSLGLIAVLPWGAEAAGAPDAFSVSAPNAYGLGTNSIWNAIDGGLLGTGNKSQANLANSCVTTTLEFPYDPSSPNIPPVIGVQGGTTAETNNLNLVNTPIATCAQGLCSVSFHGVSQGWSSGQRTCYPQDTPVQPLPPGTPQGTFEDDDTQHSVNGTNVHICAGGALLIGVDATNNRFLCSNAFLLPAPTTWDPAFADSSTRANFSYGNKEHSVHVCPTDSAMIGWNKDKNWLICRPLPPSGYVPISGFGAVKVDGPGGTQVTEPKHPDQKMHACDSKGKASPLAMSGIEAADNVLICMNSLVTPRLQ